jgi:biotin carboxylase
VKRILLLLPSTTYHATGFLEAAERIGVEVVVGTDRRQAVADPERGKVVPLPFHDPAACAREVAAFAARFPLTAIVPTDDATAVLAAVASEALGLPASPPDAAFAAGRKHVLRRRLAAAGLPAPWFRLAPLAEGPDPLAATVAYPCVLKPTFLAASRGVIRADDPGGFGAAFRRVAAILSDPEVAARGGDDARAILVEGFVRGPEHALEGLLRRGRLHVLALFDKPDPLDGPFFEETLYVTPSRLPAADQERIAAAVERAAAAIGLVEGPIHAETRAGDGDPVVIDLAARMIGGRCARALRFGAGIGLEDLILRHALDPGAPPPPREAAAAGVLMLPIPRAGVLREMRGLDEARGVPGIAGIEVTIPEGQPIVPLPEGDRYLGFAFARGSTPEAVEAALREAGRRIHPVIA